MNPLLLPLFALVMPQEHAVAAAAGAQEGAEKAFNVSESILGHVSNSSIDHPLISLPPVLGINFSVTKHVFMLWVVAATLFVVITAIVRRYVKKTRLVPSGAAGVLEIGVDFVQNDIVEPNIGHHWSKTWTPLILSLFTFILGANLVGLFPIFDVLGLLDHYLIHSTDHSFFGKLLHGGSTATGNFNVTAGLAVVSFFAIIAAGTLAHGFVKHFVNLVPKGLPLPLYVLLIPMEIIGMFVRPFALTMRLAANMTGGHIAILAIISFVFIFKTMVGNAGAIGLGVVFSLPLAAAISGLEIIVVLVQAYVFSLLTAVFIGMAIHADH